MRARSAAASGRTWCAHFEYALTSSLAAAAARSKGIQCAAIMLAKCSAVCKGAHQFRVGGWWFAK